MEPRSEGEPAAVPERRHQGGQRHVGRADRDDQGGDEHGDPESGRQALQPDAGELVPLDDHEEREAEDDQIDQKLLGGRPPPPEEAGQKVEGEVGPAARVDGGAQEHAPDEGEQ